MAEEAHDPLDRFLQSVEVFESRIYFDCSVEEDTTEARILRRVDEGRLADRHHHPFGRTGVQHRIVAAGFEILPQRHLMLLLAIVALRVDAENLICGGHACSRSRDLTTLVMTWPPAITH